MITSAPVAGRTNQIGNWSKPGSTQTESEEKQGSSASILVDYACGLGIRPRNARRLVAYYLQNLAAEMEFGAWIVTYADPTGETAVRGVRGAGGGMTAKQSRPGGAASEALAGATQILPIAHAHLYGVGGVSQTEARMQVRRGLQSLSDAWPDVLVQIIRRAIQQALLEALPAYWCRRAETFEAVGTAAADASARACRRHAWLLAQGLPHDVAAELDEWLASEVV